MEFIDNELEKIYKLNELNKNLLRLSELSNFCCDQIFETLESKEVTDENLMIHVSNYVYLMNELLSIQTALIKLMNGENI